MDLLSLKAFKELMESRGDKCISLFMPTQKTGKEVRQNSIRYKNILQTVERKSRDGKSRDGKTGNRGIPSTIKTIDFKGHFLAESGNRTGNFLSAGRVSSIQAPHPIRGKGFC